MRKMRLIETTMNRVAIFIGALILAQVAMPHRTMGASSQSLGDFVLEEVAPRIITPNGDNANDVIFFKFRDTDSLLGIPLETGIFDINGAHVADLTIDSANDNYLKWDGRDDGGNNLPSGIYIYSIKIGKNTATGTVVVAR